MNQDYLQAVLNAVHDAIFIIDAKRRLNRQPDRRKRPEGTKLTPIPPPVVQGNEHWVWSNMRYGYGRNTARHNPRENYISILKLHLDNKEITGSVGRIVPFADARSRSFQVKVIMPSGLDLKSGMFSRVSIPLGGTGMLLIPRTAITEQGQLDGVYVVDDHVIDLMELRSLALVIPIPDTLNNLTLNLKVMLFAHSATATTAKSYCCQTRNDTEVDQVRDSALIIYFVNVDINRLLMSYYQLLININA